MGRSVDEDAAIKIVTYECGEFTGLAKEIGKQIKALPTAVQERPKGKWITDKSGNVICSACKWYAPKVIKGCFTTRRLECSKTDFCGHCGADMREDADDIP